MITRYNPFKDIVLLRDEINKAFDDKFLKEGDASISFNPHVDVSETETNLIIRAELAGMSKDDIHIDATSESITISGDKAWIEKEGEKYHKIERFYGSFQRTFSIGVPVDPENIKASFKDGVLEIRIPKAEQGKARKIEIATD